MRNLPNERLSDQPRTPAKAGGQDKEGSGPRPSPGNAPHAAERKCILSGEHAARDDLIRLALGPDGQVAPDVRARAPGRGAWIGVDRAALEAAQAKGKLKGALARAFKTERHRRFPPISARGSRRRLRQAALDRLGLEARAGNLVLGTEKIETRGAARRRSSCCSTPPMPSDDGRRKLDQAWRVGRDAEGSGAQGLVLPAARAILSLALGRENVVHVAIIDRAAAARVSHALDRWRAFIGREDGLSAATAETPGASAVDVK